MDVVNAEQVRDLPLHVSKRNTHRMRRDLLSDRRGSQKRPGCVLIWFSRRSFMDISYVFQACAVMALERVPADIRAAGGVARMVSNTVFAMSDDGGGAHCSAIERPFHDQGDRRGRDHPCHGQGAHRALC